MRGGYQPKNDKLFPPSMTHDSCIREAPPKRYVSEVRKASVEPTDDVPPQFRPGTVADDCGDSFYISQTADTLERLAKEITERGNDMQVTHSKNGLKVFEVSKKLVKEISG